MTADEYLAHGETFERYELIDGVVVMSPSPTPTHNEIIMAIALQLAAFARATRRFRVFPETDLVLSPTKVYRPDIVMFAASRLPTGKLQRLDLPPDLLVEVLSPSTKSRDLVGKLADYDRFGVAEYWVADPVKSAMRCWQRQSTGLHEIDVRGVTLPSHAIEGFVLDLAEVWTIG